MIGLYLVLAWAQEPAPVELRVGEPAVLQLTASEPLARVVLPDGELTLHVRSSRIDVCAGVDVLENRDGGAGFDEERWIAAEATREWHVGADGPLPAEVEIEVTRGRYEPALADRVRAETAWYRAACEAESVEPRDALSRLLRIANAHKEAAPAAVLETLEFLDDLAGPTPSTSVRLNLRFIEFEARVALGDTAGTEAPGTALLEAEASELKLSTDQRYQILHTVGAGWTHLERYSLARSPLERAVTLDVDDHRRAHLHALLTDVEAHTGGYEEAWTWLRALERYCEGPAPNPKLVVDCASSLSTLDQPGEALHLLDDRAELIDAAAEDSTIHAAYLARGLALEALERFAEADAAYGFGLTPPDRTRAQGWDRFALAINQARCRRVSGDLDGALEAARTAGVVAAELGSPDSLGIALDTIALIQLDRDRPLIAAQLATLAVFLVAGSENVEYELALESTRVRAWVANEDFERARDALSSTERVLEERCRGLSAQEAASVRSGFVTWAELGVDLAVTWSRSTPERAPELAREALARVSRWKGRSVLGENGITRPENAMAFAERVQAALGERVLVEYVAGARDLCAVVVSRQGVTLHRLGDRRALRERARRFTAEVLEEESQTLSPAAFEVAGHELFELLLGEPLAEHGAPSPAELVVAPTPGLALLPFEALVTDRPEAPAVSFQDLQYLVRSATVTTTPSALFVALRGATPTSGDGRALILGDPIYLNAVGPSGRPLPRLERSGAECSRLAQLLLPPEMPDRAELASQFANANALTVTSYASPEHSPVQLKLGAEATPDELTGDLESYSLVYVAAHAHGNPVRAGDCAIQLSPSENGRRRVTFDDIRKLRLGPALVVLAACESAVGPVQRGDGLLSLGTAFLSVGARDVLATRRSVEDGATFALMSDFASRLRGFDVQTRTWTGERAEPAEALRWALLQSLGEKTGRGGLRASSTSKDLTGHPHIWARWVLCGS